MHHNPGILDDACQHAVCPYVKAWVLDPHPPLPLLMRCARASIASAAGSIELVRICMLPPLRPP